jgi:hypothetical protein
VLEKMANITCRLFSGIPNFKIDDNAIIIHKKLIDACNVEADNQRPSKAAIDKAQNMMMCVWKSILQVKSESSEMAVLYLTPLQGCTDTIH